MKTKNSTNRFSDRVDHFIRCRPAYPKETMDYIFDSFNLTEGSIIADIGSGTGELCLGRCKNVYAVEPNDEMRQTAEDLFSEIPSYISVCGTAGKTTLDTQSVDCITAALSSPFAKIISTEEYLNSNNSAIIKTI